jgi:predicted Zn-dependent protease
MDIVASQQASEQRLWSEAERLWQCVFDETPDNSEAAWRIGQALLEQGKFDQADKKLASATTRFPESEWALVNYASCAVRQADWAEAFVRWKPMLDCNS